MQVLSSKADVTTEYDGKELQGFAAAFGIFGHPRKGDGEAITSDWCLLIKPADAAKAIKQMQKLGFSIEDQRKEDGYINFTGAITSGTFSFDCFKKGDCALTVSNTRLLH